MRNILICCGVLLTALNLPAAAADLALANPEKPIIIKPDQNVLSITLKSNRTTGYTWFLKYYDHDLLVLKSHQYKAPDKNLPGAAGLETWQFTLKSEAYLAPQTSEIDFAYQRPWEIDDSANTTITWRTFD